MPAQVRQSSRSFLRLAAAAGVGAALIAWRAPAAEPASQSQRITAVTLIHGIPGKEEDLRQHLLSLTGATRAEAGCITYDLYQSPDNPYEFMRFEVWGSLDALEAHKKTPHLRASFEKRQKEGWTTQIMVFKRVTE